MFWGSAQSKICPLGIEEVKSIYFYIISKKGEKSHHQKLLFSSKHWWYNLEELQRGCGGPCLCCEFSVAYKPGTIIIICE